MANNYTVSSITLYKENLEKPFKYGPFTKVLIKQCTSWFDLERGVGVVDASEVGSYTELLIIALLESMPSYGKKGLPEPFFIATFSTFAHYCDKLFGCTTWTTPQLREFLMNDNCVEEYLDWEYVWQFARLEEPETNIFGYLETFSSYCDKLRHDEFIGGGFFVSDVFSIHSGSFNAEAGATISKLIMSGDFNGTADAFWNILRRHVYKVKDSGARAAILHALKDKVDNEIKEQIFQNIALIPNAA